MNRWMKVGFVSVAIALLPLLASGKLVASFQCGDWVQDASQLPLYWKDGCETITDGDGLFCESLGAEFCAVKDQCHQVAEQFRCGTPADPEWCLFGKLDVVNIIGYCKPCDNVLGSGGEVECYGSGGECEECECVICGSGIAYVNAATCNQDLFHHRKGFMYLWYPNRCAEPDP